MRRSAIAVALGFHLGVTILIFLAGKMPLLQPFINSQGVIVGDSQTYQSQVVMLADVLARSGVAAWFYALLPLHVKLYSLCFALFGRWFGTSILSIELLNATFFLSILYLIFKLSREMFEPRASLIAVVVVGLWPSFLLYTTQFLRDPLFIVLMLLFLLFNLRWLTRTYSLIEALMIAALGAVLECALWLSRSDMWPLISGIVFIALVMAALRMLKERKIIWWNMTGAALLFVLSLIVPLVAVQFYKPAYDWAKSYGVVFNQNEALFESEQTNAPSVIAPQQIKAYLPARISSLRERFIMRYAGAGSNIDTEIRFNSTSEIISYLPRAMMIGLFAPFPQMWFAQGAQAGWLGRLIAGGETLLLYIIELMALVALWYKRSQLSVWLLWVVAVIGVTALSLVVTNIGALYRLRCVFVVLLVILGSEGIQQTIHLISSKRTKASGKPPAT